MGYGISLNQVRFFIAEKDKYAAYKAFKQSSLAEKTGEPIRCIEEALEYFGYAPENDADDNIVDLEHTFKNLGNEEELFSIIAPYVKDGSFIEVFGDDGELWRWVFTKGEMNEITPKIEW